MAANDCKYAKASRCETVPTRTLAQKFCNGRTNAGPPQLICRATFAMAFVSKHRYQNGRKAKVYEGVQRGKANEGVIPALVFEAQETGNGQYRHQAIGGLGGSLQQYGNARGNGLAEVKKGIAHVRLVRVGAACGRGGAWRPFPAVSAGAGWT